MFSKNGNMLHVQYAYFIWSDVSFAIPEIFLQSVVVFLPRTPSISSLVHTLDLVCDLGVACDNLKSGMRNRKMANNEVFYQMPKTEVTARFPLLVYF